MTKLIQYSECFWGTDYTGTAGYDVLSRHNSEQKKFLHDYEEFLRKRSKIEGEYCKSLGQLSKSMKEHSGFGALEKSWNCLRAELESCKQAHEDSGTFFSQHAEEAKRFCREVTARRDSVEDRLKKVQNQKATQYKAVMNLCKTYGQKCREKDQNTDSYKVTKRSVTSTLKELDKAKSKMDKSVDDANKADSSYKQAVFALEDTRQEWEREMEQACKEFQGYDEEQTTFLRSEMWMALNRIAQTALEVDESCERVRKLLEQCDIDEEIQVFISTNMTGTERPDPVLYQNYYQPADSSRPSSTSSPIASPNVAADGTVHHYSVVMDDPTYSMVDATYSTADPVPEPSPRFLTVIKSFTQSDFSIQPGEKVVLLRKVTSNMIEVRTKGNKMGHIPINCVRESL